MAETKTKAEAKAQSAADQKQENKVSEAAGTWTETLRDAGKAVADSAVAMQDRNIHFAQSLIEQSFHQIESQTTTLHELYTTVASQSDARRTALRNLTREVASAYLGFLAAPVRLYRRAAETTEEAAKQATGTEA